MTCRSCYKGTVGRLRTLFIIVAMNWSRLTFARFYLSFCFSLLLFLFFKFCLPSRSLLSFTSLLFLYFLFILFFHTTISVVRKSVSFSPPLHLSYSLRIWEWEKRYLFFSFSHIFYRLIKPLITFATLQCSASGFSSRFLLYFYTLQQIQLYWFVLRHFLQTLIRRKDMPFFHVNLQIPTLSVLYCRAFRNKRVHCESATKISNRMFLLDNVPSRLSFP